MKNVGIAAVLSLCFSPLALAQTQPSAAQGWEEGADQLLAPTAPPEVREQPPSNPPFAGALWASSRYEWTGSQWVLEPGSWIQSMEGYQFVNGYWTRQDYGWAWVSGGWARPGSLQVEIPFEPAAQQVAAPVAPPSPQYEVQTSPPGMGYVWAPGYWYWDAGNYVWLAGSWVMPPRPGLVFVRPTWSRRGSNWIFGRGGWGWGSSAHVTVPLYPHVRLGLGWGWPAPHYAHGGRPWRHYGGHRGWARAAPHLYSDPYRGGGWSRRHDDRRHGYSWRRHDDRHWRGGGRNDRHHGNPGRGDKDHRGGGREHRRH